MRTATWLCAAIGSAAVCCGAQGIVRFEWDLVARTGDVGSGLTDVGAPVVLSGSNRTIRIELRYRLVAQPPPSNQQPARGLASTTFDILGTASPSPQSSGSAGSIQKARLTAGQAYGFGTVGVGINLVAAAPENPDLSGFQDGVGPNPADYRGLMSPFRGGLQFTGDNANVVNGTVSGLDLLTVTPVALSEPNQRAGAANGQNQWWGIYAIEYTAPDLFDGQVTFRTQMYPDPISGNAFGYFSSAGTFTVGQLFTEDSIVISVQRVPAPSATIALMCAGGLIARGARRRGC